MPAFDNDVKTATVIHDISANVTQASAAVNLGRVGFPEGLTLVVHVTEASLQDFSANGVEVYLEYTTDNGTTYRRAGGLSLEATASGVPTQLKQAPVGFIDIDPEQHAEADIDFRVVSDIGAVIANADDFSWIAYLTGRMGFPSEQDA